MKFERSDNFEDIVYDIKILHGTGGVGYMRELNFNYIPKISNDIRIICITNMPRHGGSEFNQRYLVENKNMTRIVLEKDNFKCGSDLIYPIYYMINDIKEKYILYIDYTDTIMISDLLNPQEILDYYNCKMLFNAEDGYGFPDHACVDKSYLEKYSQYHNNENKSLYYGEEIFKAKERNVNRFRKHINSEHYEKSLNSGIFLGETEFVKEKINEMVQLMEDDPIKGYPYGEIENQKLWQYIMSKDERIEIDYLDKFFIWAYHVKIGKDITRWEHFNFFNKML